MRESEYRNKLMDYLRKNMQKGYNTESLRWALVDQGYSRTMIDSAIKEVNGEILKLSAQREKPVITHEVVGENDQPLAPKKSWWKSFFGLE